MTLAGCGIRRVSKQPKPAPSVGGPQRACCGSNAMGGIIYLVGLVVIVLAILSFLGLR